MSAIGHNRQVCGVSSCSRQWFHTFASDTRPPITRSRVLLDDDGGCPAGTEGDRSCRSVRRAYPVLEAPHDLGWWSSNPGKHGCPQTNQVTFTKSCRCNNSSGENFTHDLKLVGVVKHLQPASKASLIKVHQRSSLSWSSPAIRITANVGASRRRRTMTFLNVDLWRLTSARIETPSARQHSYRPSVWIAILPQARTAGHFLAHGMPYGARVVSSTWSRRW
jgi:hypothetical protein